MIDRQVYIAMDHLQRLLDFFPVERSAQNIVTRDRLPPRALESATVEPATQFDCVLIEIDTGRTAIQSVKEHTVLRRRDFVNVFDAVLFHFAILCLLWLIRCDRREEFVEFVLTECCYGKI